MKTLTEFTESFGFVVFFLIGVLAFTMIFGNKAAFIYLLLVLLGMVLTNTDKISALVGRFSKA